MWFDPATNIAVYETPDPAVIMRYVSEARQLTDKHVGVPATFYNLQLLRWLELPVVEPLRDYDWPRGSHIEHPTSAQKLMANFQVLHAHCFNLSDMGTMKTLATLWAADFLMTQHKPGDCRAVIVAPLSILQRVWGDAIFRNLIGRRTFEIVHGNERSRRKSLAKPADFYIINFDGVGIGATTERRKIKLDGLSKELSERSDIRICIIDEGSAYRDSSTKRHKIARLVIGERPYLWLLTGTPTPNGPTDAYGLAKLVNKAWGETWTSFKNRTTIQLNQFKFVPRRGAHIEARKLLRPSIRFDIKDVWDGPALTTQQRDVELSDEQHKHLKDLKRNLQIIMKSGHKITPANEAALRMKLIQIYCGAIYDHDHKAHFIDASPRINELMQVIEQSTGKLLIFAPLTSVVELVYRKLNEAGISCAKVHGAVKQSDRSEIFRAFQADPEPHAIVADPGCMAHGLDLWRAHTTLWYGPTDKTELYLQANKRAHRPGQKFPVTVVQFVASALERAIYKRLEGNESVQGLVLDMVREDKLI